MKIWKFKKKYPSLNWFENFMGGHINIGKHILIYGENAMNWVIEIHTKKGWLYITLPTWRRIVGKDIWYIYLSPDGTPNKSLWYKSNKKIENYDTIF